MSVLGAEGDKAAAESVDALLAHVRGQEARPVYLIVNYKIQLVRAKDYTPRIVPIPHKLDKVGAKLVLLVTKDPSTPYRAALTEKGSPTEDCFNQIYTLTKVRSMAKDPRKALRLFKEFDVVVADHRVHKFLPGTLGAQFYAKNKKIPYMIQMAKPDPHAQLTRGKKSAKLKDERCDAAYVRLQLRSIVGNTSFVPPANGNCMSIKVGYSDWLLAPIVANIAAVMLYLVEARFAPVGGVLRTMKNVQSVHVKTSESASMPVWRERAAADNVDDDDSDFDF